MHAFILAGGFATRLWPLTEKRAKPLLPLAGKPLLTWIVENIPTEIPVTVSTNAAFAESFYDWGHAIDRENLKIRIEMTRSDDEKLGTLGATAQWITQDHIQEDLLLLTGDNYFGFKMSDFLAAYRDNTTLIAAYDIGDRAKASAFGTILLNEEGTNVVGFEEKPAEPKTSLVSTGCSMLPASVLANLVTFAKEKPDNVGGIFEELLRLGKPIDCFQFSESWFDVGSFESYIEATKALVGNTVLLGKESTVSQTQTEGSVVTGNGTKISQSTLIDTVLFEDCVIENCVLERCIIDNGCKLRGVDLTGKMIRAGTVLNRQ